MLSKSSTRMNWKISVAVGGLLALLMGGAAFASKGLVQDRRVTMAQAKAMAEKAQSESGFPIVVNDLVLKQLNRFIGTPEGRVYMRKALEQMENHKAVVNEHLQRYDLPSELMAVPIIESGYRNLEQSKNPMKAAGLWQFIPSTARNYGLRVNDQKDERLDIPLETDAAMRYLQSNNLRFKDWHLSVLAYYVGESAVQRAIEATSSRDAWTLVRKGYGGNSDYLPKILAAVLIMKNPESVK